MNIEELMLGDWVTVVPMGNRVEPFVAQVCYIHQGYVSGNLPKNTKASYEDEYYGWTLSERHKSRCGVNVGWLGCQSQ